MIRIGRAMSGKQQVIDKKEDISQHPVETRINTGFRYRRILH